MVYGRLGRFAGQGYECNPTVELLAEEIGLGRSQCRIYLKELADDGFIKIIPADGQANSYMLVYHKCFAGVVGEPTHLPLRKSEGVPDDPTPPEVRGGTPPEVHNPPLRSSGAPNKEVSQELESELEKPSVGSKNGKPKPYSRFGKKERKLGLAAKVAQGMATNGAETPPGSIFTPPPVVSSAPGYDPLDGWYWFSSAYPQHRVNKTTDLQYWKMTVLDEKTEDLIRERLPAFVRSRQWAKDGGEYIPSAKRFLEKRIFTMTPGPPGEVVEKLETREEYCKRMGWEP